MPPDPPSAGMLRMPACFVRKYLTSPTSTMMTGLVVPALFKSLDPPLFIVVRSFDLVLHGLVLLLILQYVKGVVNRFGVNIHAMTSEWHRLQ